MNRIVVQKVLAVIDDFSYFSLMFILKSKSETSITHRGCYNYIKRKMSQKFIVIYSDNGGKYISNELNDFFLTSGVIHNLTTPDSPDSNGIAEYFK
jgi:transposase InsO family protein